MQVKNNYDMDWEKETQTINSKGVAGKSETNENMNEERNIGLKEKSVEVGKGVFNGEIGTITEVSEKNKIVEIKFDDEKTAYYDYTELEQIEHSYAITIHKAQRK